MKRRSKGLNGSRFGLRRVKGVTPLTIPLFGVVRNGSGGSLTDFKAASRRGNSKMANIVVDFVAFDDDRDVCLLVLVEQSWQGMVADHLQKLQDRIYGCLEACLDGQLAQLFPKSSGKTIVIRIDCYDIPHDPIDGFIQRFANGISGLTDYSPKRSPYIREFQFEVSHDNFHGIVKGNGP
jgi:hypothetical protein